MLVVHHLGISQSERIVWLCEELEIPYALKRYARDPNTRLAPAEYSALTPFGTAPVIEDDGLFLGESAAIVDYLINVHGGGRFALRPGDADYPHYLFWFHFANGSLMPAAMTDMMLGRLENPNNLYTSLRQRLDRAYAHIESRLGEAPYLAGDAFTAADILALFPLTTFRFFAPRDLAAYPNIRAYLRRIAARPAYQRALDKAEPDFRPPLQ